MEIKTAEEFLLEIDRLHEDDTVHATKEEIFEIMVEFSKQFIDLAAKEIWEQSYLAERNYNKKIILNIKQLIK